MVYLALLVAYVYLICVIDMILNMKCAVLVWAFAALVMGSTHSF